MNQSEHELVLLQMLKEIGARGTIFSGDFKKVQFLIKNGMITKGRLVEPNGSQRGRIRYTITPVGAGLVAHLIGKHSSKELPNAAESNERRDAGETVGSGEGSIIREGEGRQD